MGKTQGKHGKGNPPIQRQETPGGKGEGKRGKGNPTNPERNRKAPLDAGRKDKNTTKSPGGSACLSKTSWMKCVPSGEPRQKSSTKKQNNKNTTHKSCRQSVLLILVVLKNNSRRDNAPPPWDPKTEKSRNLTGPKLKGLKIQDRSPKAPDLFKFPKHESQTLTRYQTHKSTALRKTQRGGGAHGPPRFSGESLRGTLVPRSRSSPTKVTAPGSAIAFKVQIQNWDPRDSSAASPPLRS